MDGMLTDLNAIPDMTDGDVERLLAALTRETRRVERVELSFGAVWIKRYGTGTPADLDEGADVACPPVRPAVPAPLAHSTARA